MHSGHGPSYWSWKILSDKFFIQTLPDVPECTSAAMMRFVPSFPVAWQGFGYISLLINSYGGKTSFALVARIFQVSDTLDFACTDDTYAD